MVRAIISFDDDENKSAGVKHLEKITSGIRHLLIVFYDNLTESR
jgi:hypothetical protein